MGLGLMRMKPGKIFIFIMLGSFKFFNEPTLPFELMREEGLEFLREFTASRTSNNSVESTGLFE
eukprot:CAMPEP_0204918486 /NCGR_PEP_ID=MMETSP1397-20131031/16182_1 /ASSEMBLY_ACC=CAM_ASM_000891 /TAXON_ID=49980 /ORGANISM="Climacostomum Climacostomum virens, Strain Stock W-24" /LENGTH=63 /DNA_ID=CAMNT_0052091795 /DNA_START=928 /DNA_END=1116 /DNA_ORIENTATION=-